MEESHIVIKGLTLVTFMYRKQNKKHMQCVSNFITSVFRLCENRFVPAWLKNRVRAAKPPSYVMSSTNSLLYYLTNVLNLPMWEGVYFLDLNDITQWGPVIFEFITYLTKLHNATSIRKWQNMICTFPSVLPEDQREMVSVTVLSTQRQLAKAKTLQDSLVYIETLKSILGV